MARWTSWLPIEDAASRDGPFGGMFGLYQIRAVSRTGAPIPIQRFAGSDSHGVIYIGRSGYFNRSENRTIANRIGEFIRQGHSGGKTYARADLVLRRIRRFSQHVLEVRGMILPDDEISAGEAKELRRYFNAYAELPPCNSNSSAECWKEQD